MIRVGPRRVLRGVATALAAMALLAAGAAGGQFLWPRLVVVQEFPDPAKAGETGITMPNLLGLPEADARAAVADAGHAGTITVTQREAAGTEGTTVEQAPLPGSPLTADTEVGLVTSSTATMPDVVGEDQRTAQTMVEALGGAAQFDSVVDATAPAGSVLGSTPEPGAPMPQVVRLQVATGGAARPLTDLDALDSTGCRRESALMVDGRPVANALACRPGRDRAAGVTYAISRKVAHLRFTLGISDAAPDTTARAGVTLLADGKVVLSEAVSFGASTDHSVRVVDALRLEFVITTSDADRIPEVVIGDPALIGLPTDLDQLP